MKYFSATLISALFLATSVNAANCPDSYITAHIPSFLGQTTTVCIPPQDVKCKESGKCSFNNKELRDAVTSLQKPKEERK